MGPRKRARATKKDKSSTVAAKVKDEAPQEEEKKEVSLPTEVAVTPDEQPAAQHMI